MLLTGRFGRSSVVACFQTRPNGSPLHSGNATWQWNIHQLHPSPHNYLLHMYINIWMGVVQNYGTRKRPKTPRFREPFAPFRAPAESGHEIMIRFSFTYKFINIMVFRPFANLTPPFRGLSPLQQNIHIHICRCHSDTKSLAWVLGRLPYIYIYIYIYIEDFLLPCLITGV